MAKYTGSSSDIFGIVSKNLMNNCHELFAEICRTCLLVVRNNLHTIFINSIILDAEEISFRDKLCICYPELDLRIYSKATLCVNCLDTINILYKFTHKFDKSKSQFHEHFASTVPSKQSAHLFENYSCKDEVKTEEVDLYDDEKVSSHRQNITKPFKRLQHTFKIKMCTEKKLFKCSVCNYSSPKKSKLKRHLRIHTGEKPFKCYVCDYSCTEKSHLIAHLRIHTGEKPFKCSYCNFKCIQNGVLKRHLSIHTGEKPFKCTYCNFRCIQNGVLKRHLSIHTGEKPFKCCYCNFKCVQKSDLKRHLNIHTGEKPSKCSYCDYSCIQKYHLKRHLRIHTEKVFKY